MGRGLIALVALLVAGVAGFALLRLAPGGPSRPDVMLREPVEAEPVATPNDHIDDASRQALRDILRSAEEDDDQP